MTRPLPALLDEGVARGIITAAQRAALQELGGETDTSARPSPEAPGGFSGVNVAYALGALLVLFAFGWFLVSKWAALGGRGVLGVSLAYAALLLGTAWQLRRLGFPRAAAIADMLAVSLAPLVAWSILDLTGEWPRLAPNDPFFRYAPYMASRYLVLDLATLLVALLAWRQRRFPALMLPIAVALWWTWFHLSQLLEIGMYVEQYLQWIMLACALALLALADMVERWQRTTGVRAREGDYAAPLWYVGLLGFAVAYMAMWLDADEWKHLMPVVAGALIALSLVNGRRGIAFVGVLGVFGYLAYLASDVFKTGAAFPIVLAALGILTILATVWLQRRLPGLTSHTGGDGRLPPWPAALSWLPVGLAVAMGVFALRDVDKRRAERERGQREEIVRRHREAQAGEAPTRKPPPVP